MSKIRKYRSKINKKMGNKFKRKNISCEKIVSIPCEKCPARKCGSADFVEFRRYDEFVYAH